MIYEELKLDNQLCFPLYACSREIVRRYTPLLAGLGLTYTQYITMLVLWEHNEISAKNLGEKLFLDSGTLTPVLKVLEKDGLITRTRSKEDERVLIVGITETGKKLQEEARQIPYKIAECTRLSVEEGKLLYSLLHKILDSNE